MNATKKEATVQRLAQMLDGMKTPENGKPFIELETDGYSELITNVRSLINVCRATLYGTAENMICEASLLDVYNALSIAEKLIKPLYWDIEVMDELYTAKD